jgi:TMEM175 potassium channel family protein
MAGKLCQVSSENSSLSNQRETGRLEAFSDGVIAVAITLLILDIHVPAFEVHVPLLQALYKDGAAYLGYVTSFLIIGLFWANHHYMFKYIKKTDHFLLLFNTLLLMCLVFLPFATALLVEHFEDGYQSATAIVYSASLLLTSIMYNILWGYASRHPALLEDGLSADLLSKMTRRYLISIPLYLLTLAISALNVEFTLVLYILIALLYALPADSLPFKKRRRALVEEIDTSRPAEV